MTKPLAITVITPSLNQGDFLEETIDSVLSQNYPALEYMIIDGGSSDQSVEIIRKYQKHLKYWVSEKDSGQSEAINKGFKRASGEVVSWLCSDDLYMPETLLKIQESFIENPGAGLVHGRTLLFKNSNGKSLEKGADPEDLYLKYFATIPFSQPSSFYKRFVLEEQGYLDERLHYAMDYDLFIRIALHYPMISIPEVLSRYRLHGASKSVQSIPLFLSEWVAVFSKFIRSFPEHSEFSEKLRQGGLYTDSTEKYHTEKSFTEEEMHKIVLYFLQNQLHGSYTVLDKSRVRRILQILRSHFPEYYQSPECRKIKFRNQYIPVPILRMLRNLLDSSEFS